MPATVVVPPTVSVQVLVAPVAKVAFALMFKGADAPKVNAAKVVIVPVFLMIIPPDPLKGVIHSSAVAVYPAGLLYCSVAADP